MKRELVAEILAQWQKDEDCRLAEFEADPNSGATLEEVFARIRRAPKALNGLPSSGSWTG